MFNMFRTRTLQAWVLPRWPAPQVSIQYQWPCDNCGKHKDQWYPPRSSPKTTGGKSPTRFVCKSRLCIESSWKDLWVNFSNNNKMCSESVQRWRIHPACGGVIHVFDNCELTKKPKTCEGKNCEKSYCFLGKVDGFLGKVDGLISIVLRKVDPVGRS